MRAIEFKNVSFRYEDMPEPVLKNASFSLEYGKLALLYGDSGQGKSTVLSILSGVIPNVIKGTLSGEIRIGGEDVSGQRISDICRRAGVVLQNASSSSTRWWMICASAFCSTTPALRQISLILWPDTFSPPMRISPESVPLITLGMTPDRMDNTVLFP